MVVRISPHKAFRIMQLFLEGLSQPQIAAQCGVNQATVSRCVLKFKKDTDKTGISAVAKEYRIMHEVDALRSLATELSNNKLTIEQAREGVDILKLFNEIGLKPKEYKTAIGLLGKIEQEGFIAAALKLNELEKSTGKGYLEIMTEFEHLSFEIKKLEGKNAALKNKNKIIAQDIKKASSAKKKEEQALKEREKEIKQNLSELDGDLAKKLMEKDLTFERLNKLEPLVEILKKMNISVEKLETYLEEHQELERLGLSLDNLKTMVKAMNK